MVSARLGNVSTPFFFFTLVAPFKSGSMTFKETGRLTGVGYTNKSNPNGWAASGSPIPGRGEAHRGVCFQGVSYTKESDS
jgi:hypothetical protein